MLYKPHKEGPGVAAWLPVGLCVLPLSQNDHPTATQMSLRTVKGRQKKCICHPTHVSHFYCKQSFRVFHTGCDRPSARLEAAENVLLYPGMHILSLLACQRRHFGLHSEADPIANYTIMSVIVFNRHRLTLVWCESDFCLHRTSLVFFQSAGNETGNPKLSLKPEKISEAPLRTPCSHCGSRIELTYPPSRQACPTCVLRCRMSLHLSPVLWRTAGH